MTRFTFLAIVLCLVAGASPVSTRVSKAFAPFPRILGSVNEENEGRARRITSTANQTDPARRRASYITGRLIDESGQPIPNAGVFVTKVGPVTGPRRSLGTDDDGRFRADDLAPGAYSVSAYVPGYVSTTEAAEREYYRPGEVVNLRMMKGGIITGTVTNSSGEPVVGVRVSLVRMRDGEGRAVRGVSQSGGFRQTDDRGVYRIYGLGPGTYLVFAGGGGQGFPPSGYDGDVPTYYPSTTRDAAAEVVLRAGQEMTGIDIRYRGDRGYIVSGTLSGSFGSEPGTGTAVLMLSHSASGALESRTFVPPRAGKGFALYGIPDGEYELVAQTDPGTENSAASTTRHVVVKGSDATGIELSLTPLGYISGRAVLETIPEAERAAECKSKRITSLDELVLVARRDEKPGAKDPPGVGVFGANEASPDEKGEFKLLSLAAARYRIETRLPGEDWFVRSMTRAGPAGSKQTDVGAAGVGLNTGQHITDLTVTFAEGAAAVRGKVIPASEGSRLPAQLRVHLVPAEPESADDVMRFSETRIDSEGVFSLTNLAPGIYYLHARAVADDQLMERNPRPLAWEATARAKLRREALAAKVVIELQRCGRVTEYVLKYTAAPAKKAEPKKTQ
jgi:carboxypeptidase family protein